MAKITGFEKGSHARRAHLKVGDDVISLGGRPLTDILDYLYFDGESEVEVGYINRRGVRKSVIIEKPVGESLGIDFGDALDLRPRRCKNKCVFCFIDQLPDGMRDTLYVKDDDYRLSNVCGNYISLTNLTDDDVLRIIGYKLSPLYISVHATDGAVRRKIMANPNSDKITEYIRLFAENGIIMHAQVVLVEGMNDGDVLLDTMRTLYGYYPSVRSLAIVPVGLTKHREGLFDLKPLSDRCMNETVDAVEKFDGGKGFCFCSDEFYVRTGREIPSYGSYGDFTQIENGVGLIADFLHNVDESLDEIGEIALPKKRIAFVTGASFKDILRKTLEKAARRLSGFEFDVFGVVNEFFGDAVTVSGLVVGGDVKAQVPTGYDAYFLPKSMLKEFEDVFLDGVTLDEIRGKYGRVEILSPSGSDLINKIIEVCNA